MYQGSTAYYYHADGLGSVTSLTDAAGTVQASYVYDSFGKLTSSTGTITNSIRYTGREFDSETGLYYYRARYYDPEVGRFMSEDPIGFSGGVNFFSYVGNNPVNFNDPMGLCKKTPTDIDFDCVERDSLPSALKVLINAAEFLSAVTGNRLTGAIGPALSFNINTLDFGLSLSGNAQLIALRTGEIGAVVNWSLTPTTGQNFSEVTFGATAGMRASLSTFDALEDFSMPRAGGSFTINPGFLGGQLEIAGGPAGAEGAITAFLSLGAKSGGLAVADSTPLSGALIFYICPAK